MKRNYLAFILAGCMILGMPAGVYAAQEEQETTAVAENGETAETGEAAPEQAAGLSDDVYSFQVEYDGTLYQFPMPYADFEAQGWTLSKNDDSEAMVGTNSYTSIGFIKGECSIRADVFNLGINELPIKECLIGGITVDEGFTDMDFSAIPVNLPNGISMGVSNVDDIKAAYGEPSDVYESDLYTKLTYEKDYYQDVELYVYTEGNTLRQISLRNFSEPEGYDKGSVSTETPDIVANYKAPSSLGEDFMEPVVEYFGDLYQLPAPVSAFEANGWSMVDVSDEDFVAGRDIEFIEMIKDNQRVRFSIYNLTENAVTLSNCFVKELQFATYDPEIIDMKLSGGVVLGAEKSDLIAMAEEKGYLYEDEDGYLRIYPDIESKIDHYLEFWFNKDESETAAASLTHHVEELAE